MTAASALTTFLCWKNRLSLWHQTYDTLRHPSISMWHFHPVLGSSRPQSGVGWGMWWFPHCCIHCYSMLLHDTRSHVCSIFTPGSELKLAETETVRSSSIKFDQVRSPRPSSSCKCCLPAVSNWQPLGSIGIHWVQWLQVRHITRRCGPYHEVLQAKCAECWDVEPKKSKQLGSDLCRFSRFFSSVFLGFFMVSSSFYIFLLLFAFG